MQTRGHDGWLSKEIGVADPPSLTEKKLFMSTVSKERGGGASCWEDPESADVMMVAESKPQLAELMPKLSAGGGQLQLEVASAVEAMAWSSSSSHKRHSSGKRTITSAISISSSTSMNNCSSFYTTAASSVTSTPCAGCKLLRRRCAPTCPFAPYFSPHDAHRFTAVHKIYGASNVSKMLAEVPESKRKDAANSLVYEANVRIRDPVYGCQGVVLLLQQQAQALQAELTSVRAELLRCHHHHRRRSSAASSPNVHHYFRPPSTLNLNYATSGAASTMATTYTSTLLHLQPPSVSTSTPPSPHAASVAAHSSPA